MLISLTLIGILASEEIGGAGEVWKRMQYGNRLEFLNFDPDPRVRYTVFGVIIGEFFVWLPLYAGTQANIQRFVSMPDLETVKRCLIINLISFILLLCIVYWTGYVIFAYYHTCDPIALEGVEQADQLLPLLANQVLEQYTGLRGFFIGGIACASLSSVSSGLNALSAIFTEDYIKPFKPKLSDAKLAMISKIVCVATGMVSFAFVFVAEFLGDIFPAATILIGITLGPTFGMFSLGMLFPWANNKGSLVGLFTSFSSMIFLTVGAEVANAEGLLPNQRLPLSTEGCGLNFTDTEMLRNDFFKAQSEWKDEEYSTLINILSISYLYTSALGFIITIIVGLVASFIFAQFDGHQPVQLKYLSPPLVSLWKKLFPEHMKEMILEEEEILKKDFVE